MMDISILVLGIAIVAIFTLIIAFSEGNPLIRIASGVVGVVFFCFFAYTSEQWSRATEYESLSFELIDKIPFEWNKAQQSYFFYHDGKWKASEEYVDHFDHSMVSSNPEYDSCYVYQVELPKIMGYFNTRWWTPNFEYRQSEDILLLSREKRTIEVK